MDTRSFAVKIFSAGLEATHRRAIWFVSGDWSVAVLLDERLHAENFFIAWSNVRSCKNFGRVSARVCEYTLLVTDNWSTAFGSEIHIRRSLCDFFNNYFSLGFCTKYAPINCKLYWFFAFAQKKIVLAFILCYNRFVWLKVCFAASFPIKKFIGGLPEHGN